MENKYALFNNVLFGVNLNYQKSYCRKKKRKKKHLNRFKNLGASDRKRGFVLYIIKEHHL